MSELIVREAVDADGPALQTLARALLADHPTSASAASGQPSLDLPATNFSQQGGRLWVVIRDEEAIGALGVYQRSRPGEFDLALVGLDKETRGLGLATALLAGADAFAEASGGRALGIWVDTRLEEALAFLERHGFVREPGLKGRQDGSDAIEIRLTRPIGGPVSSQPSAVPPAGAA